MDELTWQGFRKPTATSFITGVIMGKTLSDLKLGDEVFVVWQEKRNSTGRVQYTTQIARVGKRYGYIKARLAELPFVLATGLSFHKNDCNARANKQGFDVYLTEADFLKEQHDDQEYLRLKERITTHWGIVPLSPEVVQRIHAVLDEFNEGKPRGDK